MIESALAETQRLEGTVLSKKIIYNVSNNSIWGYDVRMISDIEEENIINIKNIDFSVKYLNNFLNFLKIDDMATGILKVSNQNISDVKWTSVFYEKSVSVLNPTRIHVEFDEDDGLDQVKTFAFFQRLKMIGAKIVLNKKYELLNANYINRHAFNIVKITLKDEENLNDTKEIEKMLNMIKLSKKENFKLIINNVNSDKNFDKLKNMGIELMQGKTCEQIGLSLY